MEVEKAEMMDKLELVKSKGHYYWDAQGVRYLDFASGGIFAAVLGANCHGIKEALHSVPMLCCYEAHYSNPMAERYKAMLREWTGYESVCLFSTGAEATEAFWRVARVATGKPGIWGGLINPDECGADNPLPDCMHGVTMGALIMAGKMRLPNPGMFKELGSDFEGKPQDITGCAIFEPYHAPSAQFHRESPTMDRVRLNMTTFPDIHFCCDEVQGGMGRTGKMFAHQWYSPEVKPEFVTIGKACGGGLPLSALLGPKEILEDPQVIEHAHLHSTHAGNPAMASVGIAVLERIQQEDLIGESYRKGLLMADLLKGTGVRVHAGKGLLAGLEMDGPMMVRKVVEACRRLGLLVCDTGRKWVKLGPAFTMRDEDIYEGCRILQEAIEEVKDAQACGDYSGEPEQSGEVVFKAGVQKHDVEHGELAGEATQDPKDAGPGTSDTGAN